MRLPTRHFMKNWSRVSVASLLAIAFSLAPSLLTHPEAREATYARVVAKTHERATQIGLATLGNSYLAIGETDETAIVRKSALEALDHGLNPRSPGGGFYPLRKAIENLAAYLIWPIVIISILHALVTARGTADQVFIKIGVQFFVVIFLLWFYPLWDFMLYDNLAKPLSKAFTNGPVVHNLLDKIGKVGGREDLAQGTTSEWSPTDQLSAFYTNDAACATLADISGGNPGSAERCFGADRPQALKAMHARSYDGYLQGSSEQKAAYFAQMDPSTGNVITTELEKSRNISWWRNPISWTANQVKGVVARPIEVISESFYGFMIQLQLLVANAVLWFVWLGVIAARVFSFTLAPIAIIWGIVPGKGPDVARRWFAGHAKIVLMPVGLSFGILLFFAFQTAIFATPLMTNVVIGAGLKFALFLGLLLILFKSSTITSIISGDVTAVAADFGNAVRNRTIQLAAVAAGGVAAGATAAGGAMLASSTGTAAVSKLATASQALKTRVLQNRVTGGLAQRLMGGALGTFSPQTTSNSHFGQLFKTGWGAVRDTARAAAHGLGSGFEAGRNIYRQSGAMDPRIASSAQALASQVSELKQHVRAMRPSQKERMASTDDATLQALSDIPNEIRDRRRALHQLGVKQLTLDPNEISSIANRAMASNIHLGTATIKDTKAANHLGTLVINNLVARGIPVQVAANPDGSLQLDSNTASALTKAMNEDPTFAAEIMREAQRVLGQDEVPTIMGRSGPIPDVSRLMQHSTAFANAMAVAAQVWEQVDREAFRRTLVSHVVGSQQNSVHELAAGNLDPMIAQRFADEDNVQYANRLNRETIRLLRMAWYIQASPDERTDMGLPQTGAFAAAMDHAQIDSAIGSWLRADSATNLSASVRQAIHQAANIHASPVRDLSARRIVHAGNQYGIQPDDLIVRGIEHYRAEAGSIFHQLLQQDPSLVNDHAKAYQAAIAEAIKRYPNLMPTRQRNETDQDYIERLLKTPSVDLQAAIFLSPTSLAQVTSQQAP